MGVIAFQRQGELNADYVMGASSVATTKVPPSGWKLCLATRLVTNYSKTASVWSATDTGTNVCEIGSTTQFGYARQALNRDQSGSGWGSSTSDSTGSTTTAAQCTFSFSGGSPSPNGANSFIVSDGGSFNAGNLYFGGDTNAQRNFASGDTEKVTPSLKAG